MNWSGLAQTALMLLFGFVSLLLILIVLIQKGRGGGLASAFGGGSGTATAFGSKTGDVLTWATSVIFGVFLLLAIALNLIANHRSGSVATPTAASASPTTAPVPNPFEAAPLTSPNAPLLPPAPAVPVVPATQP